MRLADNLKIHTKKEVTVQVKAYQWREVLWTYLGHFPIRPKAEQFREEVKKKFPDVFIVEFNSPLDLIFDKRLLRMICPIIHKFLFSAKNTSL
jgi:hypothetical protein